jgi:hypothetical protein
MTPTAMLPFIETVNSLRYRHSAGQYHTERAAVEEILGTCGTLQMCGMDGKKSAWDYQKIEGGYFHRLVSFCYHAVQKALSSPSLM